MPGSSARRGGDRGSGAAAESARHAAPGSCDAACLAAELARIEGDGKTAAGRWRSQSSVLLQIVYRDATDAELEAYAAFAESPAGQWLIGATERLIRELEPCLAARVADELAPGSPPR